MPKLPDMISRSLGGKLAVTLGLLIFTGSAAFWYASIQTDKKNLMDSTLAYVSSLSELTKRSVRNDMINFHREGIQETLESISDSEAIERVRIFNGRGRVSYSSDVMEIGHDVDSTSLACIGCHTDPKEPRDTMVRESQWTVFRGPEGYRILSFIEPIYNEPECHTSACHAHGGDLTVLGVLETDFSLYAIDMKMRKQMIETSLYILSFLVISVAFLYYVLWRLVLRPVTSLSSGMVRVSSGDLKQKVQVSSKDEIGRLGTTFNEMTGEMSLARQKLESWSQSLEEEVAKKTDEIKRTQDRLIQAEKLAALGRLTADIAHEIRNPLTSLGGFGRRLQKLATDEKEKEYTDIIVSEVERLEQILRDVMIFSRDARIHLERHALKATVMASVSSFAAACEDSSVRVEVHSHADLSVLVDKEQVRQAVNNLISNAIDAMPDGGTLRIDITVEELSNIKFVAIHVSDEGPGIKDEALPLIFEPFHTTKEIGHGTGLGLSISRKIIEEHGGFIKAGNRAGGGATVSLYFPYQSEEDTAKTPCWEFMKCGRDVDSAAKCPAYPHFGRTCWVVAGTFCEGRVQGTFAQKYENCKKCSFYKTVQDKENSSE